MMLAGGAAGMACWSGARRAWPAGGVAPAVGPTEDPTEGPVVLFQGDSVTDGGRNRAITTANTPAALGTGYPLLVASALLRARPGRGYRFFNRGVSGDKVPDLGARWDADTLALRPDVVSVLVGVNDFWHKRLRGYTGTVADFETGLADLLARTRSALPTVRLVVVEPFVLRAGVVKNDWLSEFGERRAAAARAARRAGATFVAMQRAFDELSARQAPEYWAADGVHPTPAGHAVIAERWREGVAL